MEEWKENERKRVTKVVFWNVAEIENKDEEFRRGIADWDIVVMSET